MYVDAYETSVKFINESFLSRYVYNRSLYVIFTKFVFASVRNTGNPVYAGSYVKYELKHLTRWRFSIFQKIVR